MNNYIALSNVRFRFEYWGGIAWTPSGPLFKLCFEDSILLKLLKVPYDIIEVRKFVSNSNESLERLLDSGLIVESNLSEPFDNDRYFEVLKEAEKAKLKTIAKPFWVHIQPYTFCNQNCIHCYCSGSVNQKKFNLPLDTWKEIVDKFYDFGIVDIHITGGENFIVDECFELTKYIKERGFGIGLSTNGMVYNDKIENELKNLGVDFLQISLDGATPEVNDYIRQSNGGFSKTTKNITKFGKILNPILNMVVNKINIEQVESMIVLGKELGVKEFKFFPQKSVGRGEVKKSDILVSWDEWKKIDFEFLSQKYDVVLDYLNENDSCGCASSGFAVKENGDVYPCIFGVENERIKVGNIIENSMESLWFEESTMVNFRNACSKQPCKRCECY